MKFLAVIAIFLMSFSGCEKEGKYPEPSLLGVWVSTDPVMQLPISSTDGKGKVIQFLEFKKDNEKFLKVTMDSSVQVFSGTYLIKALTANEMVLRDVSDTTHKDIRFFKSDRSPNK